MNPTLHPPATVTDVWLIEDNETFRKTVARVLNSSERMRCSRDFGSCVEALQVLGKGEAPAVILLDIGLPDMSGLEGIPLLKARAPSTHVIVLTVFDDQEKVFRAICAGASGYLLKTSPMEQITEAVREVLRGGAPMNARIARRVLDLFARLNRPKQDYGLTAREREILELMVQGLIKKEIAARLSLSFHTVDSHLRSIYDKLHVSTRTGAVAKALTEHLL